MVRLSGRGRWCLFATLATASTVPPVIGAVGVSADSPVEITQCADGGGSQQPCYSPGAVTDRTGAAVTWTNSTGSPHTVMTCDVEHLNLVDPKGCPPVPPSPEAIYTSTISPGGSASVVLTHPGTYFYYCTLLGYAAMHGTVTIGDAPQAAISPPIPGAASHRTPGGQGRDAPSSPPASPAPSAAAAAPGPLALEPRGPLPLSVGGPPPSPAPVGAEPAGSSPPPPEASAASDRQGSPSAHGAATPVGATGAGNTVVLLWVTTSITLLAVVGGLGALARRRWWPADERSPGGRPPGGG